MLSRLFRNSNIASFYLVLMCVAITPLEGYTISYLKIGAMALAPIITIWKTPYVSRATLLGGLYIFSLWVALEFGGQPYRSSSLYYTCLFVVMFNMYYNLVWIKHCFTLDSFHKLLKGILYAYIIVLILQQVMTLMGVRYFPLLNMTNPAIFAVFKFNSLGIEPSHSARILTVIFFSFLKTIEYKNGGLISIRELYSQYKWALIGFVYAMVFSGSGTAVVGLAIIGMYFIRVRYLFIVIPTLLALYFMAPVINWEPLNRATLTLEATMTGNEDEVRQADHSASSRVNILLSTWNNFDIYNDKLWLGHGMDAAISGKAKFTIGLISDYGLIHYIFTLLLIYSCCFRRFFSMETVIFIVLMVATIGNYAYGWGIMMVFSGLKYCEKYYKKR